MNQTYVENLLRPNNDHYEIYKEAKELIKDKVFSVDIIKYAIENFLESEQAYYDDYDPNKLYYKVQLQDKTRSLCFDIENLPHLLGLPNYKYLQEAAVMSTLIKNKTNSKNWLSVFSSILSSYKNDIISYDSNIDNIGEKKLNWDKIAEKVFSFLNLGILSDGDTYYFRHNISPKKYKIEKFVMTRQIISKGIEGQLRIQFTSQYIGTEEILVPTSIQFVENVQKQPIIRMNGNEYKYVGKVSIFQKQGGNYGKK